jgi:1,4-dihydroxy-2-naphthoyl-CoA hydrolase
VVGRLIRPPRIWFENPIRKFVNARVSFSYTRTIHFPDTDAAGVVYFARYLSICHEAYEEALTASGVELQTFFGEHGVVIPISRSEASYLRPLTCGDRIRVEVKPARLSDHSFAVEYVMWKHTSAGEKRAAVARTEHICITHATRERAPLPDPIAQWIERSPATAG